MNIVYKLFKAQTKIYIFCLTLIFTLFIFSCKESFLDENNPQSVGFDHIKDIESFKTAVNGIYSRFKQANYYNATFLLTPEIIGDNMMVSVRNTGKYVNHDRMAITNGDGYVTGAWSLMYQAVVDANMAISAASEIDFPEGEKGNANQLLGEAHGTRALAYFDLVRFFAQPYNSTSDASHLGVPLVLEPSNSILSPPRSTVREVYEQIIADLQKGEELMVGSKHDGHFTKVVAQALLAKVYLYMEDWENAERYATTVIESGAYSLIDAESFVASWKEKFSVESIFEIANLPNDNSGVNGIGYLVEPGGYGELLATKDVYDIYSATDVRRQLIERGTRVDGESDAYYVKKYPKGAGENDDNPKVLRLAEVYLIRAEARAELGRGDASKNAGALTDLNLINQRSDPGSPSINSLEGDALVDRIILERRKELAFEGNRLFDINRKGKDLVHIRSDDTEVFEHPNNRFIMPIPYSEMNSNDNIEQNPGWK